MIYLSNQPFAEKNKKITGAKNRGATKPSPKNIKRDTVPRKTPPTKPIQCRTNANLFTISIKITIPYRSVSFKSSWDLQKNKVSNKGFFHCLEKKNP